MTRRIEVLAFPNGQLLDIAGPLQVFASANDHLQRSGKPASYEAVVVGREGQVATSAGLSLGVEPLPPGDGPVDTLILSGGWGVDDACRDEGLLDWVRMRSGVARRTASVCSGAFLLASAGVLKGRRAVTHWQRCADFAKRFPDVQLDPDPIFIRDGNIWTSAGVTAGIDLALAMVEADLGRDVSLAVSRQLVVFLKRPGGQSQFSTVMSLQSEEDRFDRLHAWIMENLHRPLTMAELADRAGMSERSFQRHYRRATGETPARAVEKLRLDAARRLLEQGGSVARVAHRCGFGSEETLRRAFLRRFAVSPKAYRERFPLAG